MISFYRLVSVPTAVFPCQSRFQELKSRQYFHHFEYQVGADSHHPQKDSRRMMTSMTLFFERGLLRVESLMLYVYAGKIAMDLLLSLVHLPQHLLRAKETRTTSRACRVDVDRQKI